MRLLQEMGVDAAAEQIGLSVRQLRRIVLAEAGLGPKAFQRVARFQRFLHLAELGIGLAAAAAHAGYADQPHLTREVSDLSGLTPAALLAERRDPTSAAEDLGSAVEMRLA